MKFFGLDTESILARVARAAAAPRVPTVRQSLFIGGVGFALVGLAAFGVWAFAGGALTRALGEAGFYAVCAAVFIGLAGLAFGQLVIGPGGTRRMYALFTPAFAAYAALWCAAWFALAGRRAGGGELMAEVVGALAGGLGMAAVVNWGMGALKQFLRAGLVLVVGNALGYFLGKVAWTWFRSDAAQILGGLLTKQQRGVVAMLVWGILFGACFGAAIGYVFYFCQSEVRSRLATGIPFKSN